jgi:hypothetical protein
VETGRDGERTPKSQHRASLRGRGPGSRSKTGATNLLQGIRVGRLHNLPHSVVLQRIGLVVQPAPIPARVLPALPEGQRGCRPTGADSVIDASWRTRNRPR